MRKIAALRVFESLASSIRLDIYRLLVRHAPEGLVAGQIGRKVKLAPTNLSFHLKAMTRAGLLRVQQEGRFLRYRADLALMEELLGYLSAECCAGRPEKCLPRRKATEA